MRDTLRDDLGWLPWPSADDENSPVALGSPRQFSYEAIQDAVVLESSRRDLMWTVRPEELEAARPSRVIREIRKRRVRSAAKFGGAGLMLAAVAIAAVVLSDQPPSQSSVPAVSQSSRKAGDPISVAQTPVGPPASTTVAMAPTFCKAVIGAVFADVNLDGDRQVGEAGVTGFVVNAYNDANTLVASATTTSDGNFVLSIPGGAPVRVEFIDPSGSLANAPHGSGATSVAYPTAPGCRVVYPVADPAVVNPAKP